MRRFRRLGPAVLLTTLLTVATGCDPAATAQAPSSWTPRPAPTVWPSVSDLTHYLPTEADGVLFGIRLAQVGPPVSEPPPAMLRICDLTQPWDALFRHGATLTWQADGHEIRQVITTYGRVSARDVLQAIMAALDSCGSVTYEGARYRRSSSVEISAADAAEAHEIFCTHTDPGPAPHRCFALLAAHDRLTQLAFSGADKDFRDQLDVLTKSIGPFAIAVART